VGRRQSRTAIAATAVLAISLAPFCAAQAVIEGAQLSKQAKPPVAAPPILPPPAGTPVMQSAPPLHAPSAAASGPIQASVSSGMAMSGAFSAISHVPTENSVMHVTVGHQIFIDTKSRLRRVIVADPAVLNSNTLTPNQIVVTAVGPGLSSLTLLDEIGRSQSYMISSDLDMDGLRATMASALEGRHIKIEGSGGRVVLTGNVATQADADAAAKFAGMYAKEVVNALVISANHPKQVRLQVRILEVDRDKAQQYGVNLFNPGGNTSWFAGSTTSQYPTTATVSQSPLKGGSVALAVSNPLNLFYYNLKANIGTTIQDLETKQVLQILAEPTITTISGEKGDFLAGGEFPVPIVQPGGAGGAPVITVQWRPFGVKLEFIPTVNDDGTIRLNVTPEVSALDYTNAVTISGFTIPALSTRRATTQVELRNNQSFAISGLLDQRTRDMMDKSPGIASIPILGNLFKSKNVDHSATELVVIVTPSIVDPLTDASQPAQPDLPIPTLDRPKFDNSLGRDLNPRPAAPSLDPNRPAYGDAVPAPLPPDPNSPDGRIVGDAAPATQAAPAQVPSAPSITVNSTPALEAPAAQPVAAPVSSPPANNNAPASAPAQSQAKPVSRPAATPAPPAPASGNEQISPRPAVASLKPAQAPVNAVTTAAPQGTPVASTTTVEIMALSHESDADATLSALRRHGYNPAVNHSTQDSLLHLDLGPFATTTQAEAMRLRLMRDGYDATLK
jgi:pilus assembly protein CpaC